ncbi:MAG: DUF58 domain-containing protein [archaeon]
MENNEERKLNVDIPGAISELQSMLKEFRLRKDIWKIFFRGKGLEFEQYRDYTPDDDASMIDFKTSSRAQKLIVKQYKEERELEIFFVVDVGDNMVFGSTPKLKCEFMAEMVAAFSMVMVHENDRIGYVLYSDKINEFVPCSGGEKQFQIFVDYLTQAKTYGGVPDLDQALEFSLNNFPKSTASVIVVSDFLRLTSETEKKLTLLANRFETLCVRVRDPLDIEMPDMQGEVVVEDPKSHQQLIINPRVAKGAYGMFAAEKDKRAKYIIQQSGADFLDLNTKESFATPLAIFLKERIEGY